MACSFSEKYLRQGKRDRTFFQSARPYREAVQINICSFKPFVCLLSWQNKGGGGGLARMESKIVTAENGWRCVSLK